MTYSTTNVYRMKREIITFSKKISSRLPRTEQKFFADMLYGMLCSGSCLLSEIAHALHEDSRKINVVDRLSRHLAKGVQEKGSFLSLQNPVRNPLDPVSRKDWRQGLV